MRGLGISKRISSIDLVVVLLRTLAGFEAELDVRITKEIV